MDTSAIFDFLAELSRCEYSPHSGDCIEDFIYNGIPYNEGVEAYNIKLKSMLISCKNALTAIMLDSKNQPIIDAILTQVEEIENQFYDIPDSNHLSSIEQEYDCNKNESLLKQIKEVRFLIEMVELQKNYLSQTKGYIYSLQGKQHTQVPVRPEQEIINPKEESDNIIKGVDGLAKALHCGKTKANAIIQSKVLEKHKIQFYSGGLRFKKDMLDALLQENPDVFKDIRCPHKVSK